MASEHHCFLNKVSAKVPSEKLIFFDFEPDQSTGEHVINFGVAQYANGTQEEFRGYTAYDDFCEWLFQDIHKGYTALAHNM